MKPKNTNLSPVLPILKAIRKANLSAILDQQNCFQVN